MALDRWQYRNPLEVLLRNEARTCKGCQHKETVRLFGVEHEVCLKKRKKLVRCKLYKEVE